MRATVSGSVGALICALFANEQLSAQPTFKLTIDAPSQAEGDPGGTVDLEAAVLLESAGIATSDGVEGWSIGLSSDGLQVLSATTSGTAGAPVANGGLRRDDGFENIQFTTGDGNTGVVAAVVLSSATEVTLPPSGTERLLRVTVRAQVPNPIVSGGQYSCNPAHGRIFLRDGLRGSGQPVKNKVSYRGIDYRPSLGSETLEICPTLDQPRFTLSMDTPASIEGEAGSTISYPARAVLTTDQNTTGDGAEGWSVSIGAAGGNITSATTAGTAGALVADGGFRRSDGFEKTEITAGPGNRGVVSAVALSTSTGASLPPSGSQRLLGLTVETVVPQPVAAGGKFHCDPDSSRLFFLNGLRGSGQPVKNRVSFRGIGLVPVIREGITSVCPRIQEPRYALSVSAPSSLSDAAGTDLQYEALCRLTSSGNAGPDGAAGWSLSVASTGCRVVATTLANTQGGLLGEGGLRRADGFQKTEITTGPLNEGVVSAVVLSSQEGVTLPPSGTANLLRITVEGTVPEPIRGPGGEEVCIPTECRLSYTDGLTGSGQPVKNRVSYRGLAYIPSRLGATTQLCPPVENPLALRTVVLDPVSTPEGELGDKSAFRLEIPLGSSSVDVTTGVFLASDLQGREDGARGWSFSVKTDAAFSVSAADTTGTAYEIHGSGGFAKTEIVDPARNGGQQGVVTAVALSLELPRWLPPVGDELLLKVSGRIDTSGLSLPGDSTDPIGLEIPPSNKPGLKGTGTHVDTVVTVYNPVSLLNESRQPTVKGAAIRAVALAGGRFVRGNANDDAQVDISDPVWILNYLFLGGSPIVCLDSADGNNDSRVDISDAVYILGYLFLGSTAPPAPFPACGLDPEGDADGVTCVTALQNC